VFYFPGSWYVGRAVELIISVEVFPWPVPDWNDDDRRGAGSIVIGLALLAGIGAAIAWFTGVL